MVADGNDIVMMLCGGNIHTGDTVLTDDPAAFANTQQSAGVAKIAILKAGDIFFDELDQDIHLLTALQVPTGQILVLCGVAVSGMGEADAYLILATMFWTVRNVGHPVQVIVDIGDATLRNCLVQETDPLGVLLEQFRSLVLIVVNTAPPAK